MENSSHPIRNPDVEKAIVGSMIRDPGQIPAVLRTIRADDFYGDLPREIFKTINHLFSEGLKVDLVTVHAAMEKSEAYVKLGGADAVISILESVPVPENAEHYAALGLRASVRRSILRQLQAIAKLARGGDETIESMLSKFETLTQSCYERIRAGEVLTTAQIAGKILEAVGNKTRPSCGIVTWYRDLDNLILGMEPGTMNIVAARPSMGKSTFAANVALNNAKIGKKILILTYEMSPEAIVGAMMCADARVNAMGLRRGSVTEEDMARMSISAGCIMDNLFVVSPKSNDMSEAAAIIAEHVQKNKCDMVIVDYLQLLTVGDLKRGDSRQQEVSRISARMKRIAREHKIPVLAVCQLNRSAEQRDDHKPRLSDLRESGSLEQDADLVMMLYRADYYDKQSPDKGTCDVIVAKQRSGPVGTVKLTFLVDILKFENFCGQSPPEALPYANGDAKTGRAANGYGGG